MIGSKFGNIVQANIKFPQISVYGSQPRTVEVYQVVSASLKECLGGWLCKRPLAVAFLTCGLAWTVYAEVRTRSVLFIREINIFRLSDKEIEKLWEIKCLLIVETAVHKDENK